MPQPLLASTGNLALDQAATELLLLLSHIDDDDDCCDPFASWKRYGHANERESDTEEASQAATPACGASFGVAVWPPALPDEPAPEVRDDAGQRISPRRSPCLSAAVENHQDGLGLHCHTLSPTTPMRSEDAPRPGTADGLRQLVAQLQLASAQHAEDMERLNAQLRQREEELRQRERELQLKHQQLQQRDAELQRLMAEAAAKAAPAIEERRPSTSDGLRDLVSQLQRASAQQSKEMQRLQEQLRQREEEVRQRERELQRRQEELRQRDAELQRLTAEAAGRAVEQVVVVPPARSQDASVNVDKLQAELHEKTWALKRLEAEQEKELQGFVLFTTQLMKSSAGPSLAHLVDLSKAQWLGMGNYGYAMTCPDKATKRSVVVKLQSPRWVSTAAQEWMHGSEMDEHPHIVAYLEVVLHRDVGGIIERLLNEGFEGGALKGRRPKQFPTCFVCILLEFMDRGSLQTLSDRQLVSLEGLGAVARQIASALAFMHADKRTHNDIKLENILLQQVPGSDHMVVKLADLGLAHHSVDRSRDCELFGYTLWCVGLRQKFDKVPPKDQRMRAIEEFRKHAIPGDQRADLREALAQVIQGMWFGTMKMNEVAELKLLQGLELRATDNAHAELEAHARVTLSSHVDKSSFRWHRAFSKLQVFRALRGSPDDSDGQERPITRA